MNSANGISESALEYARHILSDNFAAPITVQHEEVINLAFYIEALQSYDYQIVEFNLFKIMTDLPFGLLKRVEGLIEQGQPHSFVVFDPIDDDTGYLLLGDDAVEIAKEACEYIANMEPDEGPLSPDSLAQAAIEGN